MLQVAAQAACTSAMQALRLARTQLALQPLTSAGWRCTQTPLACGVWKTPSLHAPPLRCCLFLINLVVIGILHGIFDLVLIGLLYKAYPDGCQHGLQILLRLRPYPMKRDRLLYIAYPNGCWHKCMFLLRLRPHLSLAQPHAGPSALVRPALLASGHCTVTFALHMLMQFHSCLFMPWRRGPS